MGKIMYIMFDSISIEGKVLNMREKTNTRTVFNSYVVDDGWNLPYEVIEEIEFRIAEAKSIATERVEKAHQQHKGMWLTSDVARKYAAKSWIYRVIESNQYCGKVREIGEELQHLYGVTELEAINILFENNVDDYVNKYYRIQHLIPNYVNQQNICDEIANEYLMAI